MRLFDAPRAVVSAVACVYLQDAVRMESLPQTPLYTHTQTHTPSLAAAWRLFDLDCADGSQPTGCQVGDRVDTLSGFGEEYIVVI